GIYRRRCSRIQWGTVTLPGTLAHGRSGSGPSAMAPPLSSTACAASSAPPAPKPQLLKVFSPQFSYLWVTTLQKLQGRGAESKVTVGDSTPICVLCPASDKLDRLLRPDPGPVR